MTEERWRAIEDVFNRALEIPAGGRGEWLIRACMGDAELHGEVRTLLDNDAAAAETLSASVKEAITALPESRAPRYAGPYELIGELGRGGMGTVYKARRADQAYEAVVAVKVVRPGMDTDFVLSRFRQERQSLARLNHPNIARLLDGGATADGVPYIVMEYIDGVRINEYCRRENLKLEQRLRLTLPVCLATDHAHRNFIVHRDIKPGNILVDATGTPKLLDFGICKLLHANPLEAQETLTHGMGMMTPDYASPEQVLGEAISVRSDVYSLGAVLYELLTGARPHRFESLNLLAIEAAICNAPIVLPSRAATGDTARLLRGDLDNILMRALEKDPRRRYESAAALAEDIRRYLDQEPVSARPAGALYRAGKFIRRHRALTGAVVAVLAASSIGTFAALRQARRAENREREIRTMARSVLYDVHDSVRDLPGATAARQKIVRTGAGYLDRLAESDPSDPELLRELAGGYQRIADLQGSDARGSNLGESRAALATYGKSLGFWDRLLARLPADRKAAADRIDTLRHAADLRTQLDGNRRAIGSYDRVETEARALATRFPDEEARSVLADILTVTARRHREIGDLAAARERSEEALTLTAALAAAAPADPQRQSAVASAEAALGMTLARQGDLAAAMKLYESAVARGEAMVEADSHNVGLKRNLMIGYSHLGDTLGYPDLPNLGDAVKAEAVYAKMAAIGRQLYTADPNDARAAMDYAIALTRRSAVTPDLAARQRMLEESRGLIRKRLASTPGNLNLLTYEALVELHLGDASEAQGRRDRALVHWRRAFEVASRNSSRGVDVLARLHSEAVRDLVMRAPLGELQTSGPAWLAGALTMAEKSAAAVRGSDDIGPRLTLPRLYGAQSVFHARLGQPAEAARWRQRAIDAWKPVATRAGFLPKYRQEMEEFERWRP